MHDYIILIIMNFVKGSNRYNLPIYFVAKTYAEVDHNITISIDDNIIFNKSFTANKEHIIKLDRIFDFVCSDVKTFKISWSGDKECSEKYLKFKQIVINEQSIGFDKGIYKPKPVEYFDSLTGQEKQNKITYHGHEYGWFGDIDFIFCLWDRNENGDDIPKLKYYKTLELSIPQILVDASLKFIHRRVKKNENKQI
tara:strand:+ start:2240 stop:2827 length:588 start_codon:yes stop_codon:yes gene_type:complete